MSLLAMIDGIPLFSTVEEALAWGQTYGITGSHTHNYQGQVGYMAGNTHSDITLAMTTPTVTTTTAPVPTQTMTPPTTSTSSGGGSSSGGGGGY